MKQFAEKASWFAAVVFVVVFGLFVLDRQGRLPFVEPPYRPDPGPVVPPMPPPIPPPGPVTPLPPPKPVDPEAEGLHVYVPKEMRLFNKSGSQCVWATIQMLGTLHKSKGVEGLTDRYKHATGPGEVNRVLTQRNVKFRQVNGKNLDFIEEWVTQKKMGVGIGVNGNHVILVCHFERGKMVKVIDNSDRSLRIQTWDWAKFQRHFSGWVFVILPDDYPMNTGWETSNDWDDGRLYGGV